MSDQVSRSQLWDLARSVVENTAPVRARMDDPKDPRFTGRERDKATEALIAWARKLALTEMEAALVRESRPAAEFPAPPDVDDLGRDLSTYVDGVPDRGPSFLHTISTRDARAPQTGRIVECTCGWWELQGGHTAGLDAHATERGHQHLDRVAQRHPPRTEDPLLKMAENKRATRWARAQLAKVEAAGGGSFIETTEDSEERQLVDLVARAIAASPRSTEEPIADRIATIASEAFGPFPVQTVHENLSAIERGISNARIALAKSERVMKRMGEEIEMLTENLRIADANAVRMREYRFALEGVPTDGKGTPLTPATAAPAQAKEEWHYSSNEEWFTSDPCDSREEAIAEALHELGLEPGDPFWTGRAVAITAEEIAEHITDAETIVEQIGSYFYDNVGDEAPECEFTAKPEDAKALELEIAAVIAAWLTKHKIIQSHRMDKTENHRALDCPRCLAQSAGGLTAECPTCDGCGLVLEVEP